VDARARGGVPSVCRRAVDGECGHHAFENAPVIGDLTVEALEEVAELDAIVLRRGPAGELDAERRPCEMVVQVDVEAAQREHDLGSLQRSASRIPAMLVGAARLPTAWQPGGVVVIPPAPPSPTTDRGTQTVKEWAEALRAVPCRRANRVASSTERRVRRLWWGAGEMWPLHGEQTPSPRRMSPARERPSARRMHRSKRSNGGAFDDSAGHGEAGAVAGAVPRALCRVPLDEATQVSASR
jgi:hypothetical protein